MRGIYNATAITLTDGQYSRLQLDSAGNIKTVSGATGASANQIQGPAASGATAAGNPVPVGGIYNSTLPTFTNGQAGELQVGTRGSLNIQIKGVDGAGGVAIQASNADGGAVSSSNDILGLNKVYNGSTVDKVRGNFDTAALITAAAVTTGQTGADQTNYNGRGLIVVLDMTSAGTGSVTITIQGKDAASGKYYTLLAGAAVTSNSTNVYTVYPGATATANVSAASPLPRVWRVITTANNSNATTYTVGASVIV